MLWIQRIGLLSFECADGRGSHLQSTVGHRQNTLNGSREKRSIQHQSIQNGFVCVCFFFFYPKKVHPAPAIGIIICYYYYYFLTIDFSLTLVSNHFQHQFSIPLFSASPLYLCVILCQLFCERCQLKHSSVVVFFSFSSSPFDLYCVILYQSWRSSFENVDCKHQTNTN